MTAGRPDSGFADKRTLFRRWAKPLIGGLLCRFACANSMFLIWLDSRLLYAVLLKQEDDFVRNLAPPTRELRSGLAVPLPAGLLKGTLTRQRGAHEHNQGIGNPPLAVPAGRDTVNAATRIAPRAHLLADVVSLPWFLSSRQKINPRHGQLHQNVQVWPTGNANRNETQTTDALAPTR